MQITKYLCDHCKEQFELLASHYTEEVKCPRCSSRDIAETIACSLEKAPSPWEYVCQQCGKRFRVKAPRGPTEEKEFRCPICESKNIKWLSSVSEACPPGG